MKEFNNYIIKNPDGVLKEKYGENKVSYNNDHPRFIKEDPLAGQGEMSKTKETFDLGKQPFVNEQPTSGTGTSTGTGNSGGATNIADSLKSAVSSVTNAATAGAAGITTAGAAAAGGLGAIASVVASAVATAAIVVAVFISTLTINVSLLMTSTDSLVFQLEMVGAQDEDFEKPILAVLDGNDGSHAEQEIYKDTVRLTFNDLKPNVEYLLRIRNDEKLFVEKSYITASEQQEKGYLSAWYEENKVYIIVENVVLGPNEIFTVTAKDDRGGILYVKDDSGESGTYSFDLPEQKKVYLSLTVGGVVCAVAEIDFEEYEEYDLNNYQWTWNGTSSATVSFTEIHCGDPLVLDAIVTNDTTIVPDCETDGQIVYTASVEYDGRQFSDEKIVALPALGHDFGEPEFTWTPVYESGIENAASDPLSDDPEPTPVGYSVTATFTCKRDPSHKTVVAVDSENVTHVMHASTCEEDGALVYHASLVFEEKEFADEHADIVPAHGHAYGEPIDFVWTPKTGGYNVSAVLTCIYDENHTVEYSADVTSTVTPATCVDDEFTTYVAEYIFEDTPYYDEKIVPTADTKLGHDGMTYHAGVAATFEHDGNLEYWTCSRCGRNYTTEDGVEEIEDVYLPQLTELDGKVFTAWSESDSLPTVAGSYYLTSDVEISTTWEIAADTEINLCLNGHKITSIAGDSRFLNLGTNATFGLYECEDSVTDYYWINQDALNAEITNESDYQERIEFGFSCGIIYGGYISGFNITGDGAVIHAQEGSVVNLNGGTIIGNCTNSGSGGVYYSAKGVNATLNLNGANLIGNTASAIGYSEDGNEHSGGAVYSGSGIVNMTGGELLYNVAAHAGTIRVPDPDFDGTGVFSMTGGTIAFSSNSPYPYPGDDQPDGIVVIENGTFVMTGGNIENNNPSGTAAVALVEGEYTGAFEMYGGTITNNSGAFGGVYVYGENRVFIVSGDATITDNSECNVYLTNNATITVGGELAGEIGVTMNSPAIFTVSYSAVYPDEDTVRCFVPDNPMFAMEIMDGEVTMIALICVYFDTDGGSEIEPQYLRAGEYITIPDPPTKESYPFLGWYTTNDHTEEFDFSAPVSGDETIVIYADWDD